MSIKRLIFSRISKLRRILYEIDSKKLSTGLVTILIGAASLFVVLVISYWILRVSGVSGEALGVFGDFVGGSLNPALSFLSLVAILFTIILQNRELAATRKELEASRYAHEAQVEMLQEQIEIAKNKERIDAAFQMHNRWTSQVMRDQRLQAWDYIRKSHLLRPYEVIDIREFSQTQPEEFRAFSEVCQFISDLKNLISSHRLDEDLTFTLFNESIYPWFRYLSKARFTSTKGEKKIDKNHSDEIEYELGVANWYRKTAHLVEWFDERR